jgi:DNA-binding PadR family transcriptional regulator
MFRRRRLAVFRKGVRQYLILQSLSEKPRHGYEIMKSLGEEYGGIHPPSAGLIYPTLQALEDDGYVTSEEQDGKKVYSITPAGRAFMKTGEDRVKAIIDQRRVFLTERKPLNRELRNLASIIMTNYRDLDKEQADAIARILKDTRRRINDVIFE